MVVPHLQASPRLPNLIVAGVPKAGTGSLFGWLAQHPDICPADEKEVGYFNYYNPQRQQGVVPPLSEYARHFSAWKNQRYAFEATPTYSYGAQPVIDAIKEILPGARILISLRDPVARLWSAYTFQRELGNIAMQFPQYVSTCEARRRDGRDLVPRDHFHGLYIGYYNDYIPLWLDAFGVDVRVIFAEDMKASPATVMAGVFGWLGIDENTTGLDLTLRNRTVHPRSVRAARVAYKLKRMADQLDVVPPRVRDLGTRTYQRVNRGSSPGHMPSEVRRHLEDLYRASNRGTAEALVKHGYHTLPPWLNASLPTAGGRFSNPSPDKPTNKR